jgi:hypothetical protein
MKKVSIRQNDYGYEWKVENNPRWYSIQLEQIFPIRLHPLIIRGCRDGKSVSFNNSEYNRINKYLFVNDERFI